MLYAVVRHRKSGAHGVRSVKFDTNTPKASAKAHLESGEDVELVRFEADWTSAEAAAAQLNAGNAPAELPAVDADKPSEPVV